MRLSSRVQVLPNHRRQESPAPATRSPALSIRFAVGDTGLMPPIRTFEFQGCNIAWRMDGAGPPLLMIQGVGAYGTAPNPQVALLSKNYTSLRFDKRGIGASQPVAVPLTVEQMAADGLALMDRAGWVSAHIVGHSLGGLIALQLALTAKSRVRSLSLMCTFARGAD